MFGINFFYMLDDSVPFEDDEPIIYANMRSKKFGENQ
jgi:hypothetical protein